MRAGYRLLRTQAFRPRERKQATLARRTVPQPVVRRLRDQIDKKMRNA